MLVFPLFGQLPVCYTTLIEVCFFLNSGPIVLSLSQSLAYLKWRDLACSEHSHCLPRDKPLDSYASRALCKKKNPGGYSRVGERLGEVTFYSSKPQIESERHEGISSHGIEAL
jgi:hypothetical protein